MFDATPNATCAQVDVCAEAFVAGVIADASAAEVRRVENGERVQGAGVFLEVVAVRFYKRRKDVGRNCYVRRRRKAKGRCEVDGKAVRRQDERRVDPDRLPLIEQDTVVVPLCRAVGRTSGVANGIRREADGVETGDGERAARRANREIGLSKS